MSNTAHASEQQRAHESAPQRLRRALGVRSGKPEVRAKPRQRAIVVAADGAVQLRCESLFTRQFGRRMMSHVCCEEPAALKERTSRSLAASAARAVQSFASPCARHARAYRPDSRNWTCGVVVKHTRRQHEP